MPTKLILSKEERAQIAQERKDRIEGNRYWRNEKKKEEEYKKDLRKKVKRELAVLNYMLKSDVLYHHHNTKDSLKLEVLNRIQWAKKDNIYQIYDSYVWNRYGEGKNYMSLSLLNNLWSSSEFDTIYDVPLDGSYIFYTYDSGERGLGSFGRITAKKADADSKIPFVNPGALIPITAN